MSVNRVTLLGRVGKDPEVRQITENSTVAKFSFATSETYKNKEGERVSQAEWHNIVIWGNLTKVVESYVKKGDQLYLEGKIKTRSYDDKEGQKKYMTEIVCDQLQMIGSKPSEDSLDVAERNIANMDDLPI